MVSLAQANKRRDKDVTKILVSGYEVEITNEKTMNEFVVKNFQGPKDSPYEGVRAIKSNLFFLLFRGPGESVSVYATSTRLSRPPLAS
jgi:hypothetical protein